MFGAAEYAKNRYADMPQIEHVLRAIAMTGQMPGEVFRAAVSAGTTGNATWAGPLVYAQNLASEFIDLLRPATIIGKLPLRPVPFNVSIPRQTAGAAAQWVGEGLSKPVNPLAFDRLSIPWAKMAVISVITEELARFSDPSAEQLVRDDLVAAIAAYADQQFTDPTVAPSANLRPGSITNGTATQVLVVPSTGVTIGNVMTDVSNLYKQMVTKNLRMTSMYWIMAPAALITLQNIRTAVDTAAFPETLLDPPRFRGYPVVTSTAIPLTTAAPANQTSMILVDCNEIFHASDPVIDVSASNEASLQMDSAPATPPTPLISLWQQNMLGIKAEQYQYWLRRRDAVVGMITGFQT
jgi:HK97 family phage major capsid protein